ncbi:MAG: threonine--tRNA ligase [Elusimicrobia bacterium]|nr:threonine--tRNA ligase [Elusimicrobiota bacterium]
MNHDRAENSFLEKMRHSLAHVLADAVQELFPGTKFGIGPAIEDGFYYDFDSPHHFTPEDLPLIEEKMKNIISEDVEFVRSEIKKEDAVKLFSEKGEKFKVELINELPDEKISLYKSGKFLDLCKGPHISRAGEIKSFKLMSIAGAYWRGDETKPMLQRIYGIAFETEKNIEDYLKLMEEAQKRDHRKVGRNLEIFVFDDDVGPGLPLWLPNGGIVIEEIEKLAKDAEKSAGYLRVRTPHLCKESMYLKSGHLPYYRESMFPAMDIDGIKYYLKPMNCPHHHKIYASKLRSYRDLPLRLAEYGTCYRYEQSGELFGLMRVRSMQMNDAHIYCSIEQFQEEFLAVSKMYLDYFKIFGIDKYIMRFSTHSREGLGKKYVGEPELWKKTEEMVLKALKEGNLEYKHVPDEAAFYGPKIDVEIWSAIGREFTLATNQVDFAIPARFGLVYKDKDGLEKTPLCIHRAPLGTHERFIGFLIEHYAGNFPTWLAPVHVKILNITSMEEDYVKEIHSKLAAKNIRAELDVKPDTIGLKVRNAVMAKPAYILIAGKKEKSAGVVSLRLRNGKNISGINMEEFIKNISAEISERKPENVYK